MAKNIIMISESDRHNYKCDNTEMITQTNDHDRREEKTNRANNNFG